MKSIQMFSNRQYTISKLNSRVSYGGFNDGSPDSDSVLRVRVHADSTAETTIGAGIIGFARSRSRSIAPTRPGTFVVLPWEFQA